MYKASLVHHSSNYDVLFHLAYKASHRVGDKFCFGTFSDDETNTSKHGFCDKCTMGFYPYHRRQYNFDSVMIH